MAEQVIFYTHPMSRGRIVRRMFEEIGQPYHTELLDYDTTMKAAVYLAIQSGPVGSPFSQGVDTASFVLVHHSFGKSHAGAQARAPSPSLWKWTLRDPDGTNVV